MWNIFKVNNKDTRRILTCEDVILVSGGGGFVNFEPFPSAAAGKCLPGSFEIKGNTFVKRVKACFNLNLLGLVPKFWLLVQKISEHSKQNLRQNPNLVKRRLHWRIHLLELSEQLLCRRPLSSERSIDKAIFMRLMIFTWSYEKTKDIKIIGDPSQIQFGTKISSVQSIFLHYMKVANTSIVYTIYSWTHIIRILKEIQNLF